MGTALAGGAEPVTFRDYMETALYGEGGFYSTRVPREDFYTAPELHPLFGETIADEIARRLDDLDKAGVQRPHAVVEMGSGSGRLAEQVMARLHAARPELLQETRFILVERQRSLLVSSVLGLSDAGARLSGLSDISELAPAAGVFYSNELVDALPFHLLERRGGSVQEVYVDREGGTLLGGISTPELAPYAECVPEGPPGCRHAVSLEALRWLRAVAGKLKAGFLITVDYGSRLGRQALNPPRAYKRHAESGRLTAPGHDLTANVDFESLIDEGKALGLELESFGTLGRFLLDGPVAKALGAADERSALKIKSLIHPDGMGELFKVLIQRKAVAKP